MKTIAEIYVANDKVREQLKNIVSDLTDKQTSVLPEGEKWTIAHFIEHIAIVENGMAKISAKLLRQAQAVGKQADGTAKLSESFAQKAAGIRDQKLEAPEIVRPTGNQTIAESLAKMEENRRMLEELRPLFESVECSDFTFPHPALGALTAHEWLTLIGGHEARHLRQLENLMAKAKQ